MNTYRNTPSLTEVPGSLRRKTELYSEPDHHCSQVLKDAEEENFVTTANKIKKQVGFQDLEGYKSLIFILGTKAR